MREVSNYTEVYDAISREELVGILNDDTQFHYVEQDKAISYSDHAMEQIGHVSLLTAKVYQLKELVLPYQWVKVPFRKQHYYQLREEFKGVLDFLKSCKPELDTSHYDCPEYTLFKQVCDEIGIEALQFHAKPNDYISIGKGLWVVHAQHTNQFIEKLWQALRSPAFSKMMRDRQDKSRHNFKSGVCLIKGLFQRYARLMVCRIDLALRPEHIEGQTVEEMQTYLQRFFNNRRSNALFEHMVGYIWKLEAGVKKGIHIHMILFFDGSKVYKDGYYAQRIGEYWRDTITKGRGMFYNCNADKTRYRKLGIGMIDHDDGEKIANLHTVLAYLTKSSQFVMVKTSKNYRCFGRSELPSTLMTKVTTQRGRPRRPKTTRRDGQAIGQGY